MKEFKVTVIHEMYDPIKRKPVLQELTGDFSAETIDKAADEAKEWYAEELGMLPVEIQVVRAIEKGKG